MATIVMVHGAFNELWGPNELHHRWLPALRDGLWHAGADVDPDDVAVCFYGDLFRRDPESPDQVDERTRAGVADMLHETLGDDGLAALGQAAGKATFDRTVDLVVTMTTRLDLRDRVQDRLRSVIGPDTRVLIAHSLGTIVSYRALCRNPDWDIDTFVTLGSPLGSPMITDQVLEKGEDGLAAWPAAAQRWVNVASVGDHACAQPRLAEVFGPRVVDRLVDNGHRAHDPQPYLNNPATGAAVADALARVRGERL